MRYFIFREQSCYTPKYNFCQSPDYFFCAFTNRCERDGYYNPYKYDDSYKGVLKTEYSENKEGSKEGERKIEKPKKTKTNKRFHFEEIKTNPALKGLLANRLSEVSTLFTEFNI